VPLFGCAFGPLSSCMGDELTFPFFLSSSTSRCAQSTSFLRSDPVCFLILLSPRTTADFLPVSQTAYVLLLALSSANVSGSTKKAISSGAIFVGYCVGNIIGASRFLPLTCKCALTSGWKTGPYTVFPEEKPQKYRSTWIALYVSLGVVCGASLPSSSSPPPLADLFPPRTVASLVLRFLLARENAARDAAVAAASSNEKIAAFEDLSAEEREQEQERVEKEDLTDFENRRFRYTL
jgi:hypothetical protein